MIESEAAHSMRDDVVRFISETYHVEPERFDGLMTFRAGNGRIFASMEDSHLDVVCGRKAMGELIRPYLRPCDARPDNWVSVDLDSFVRFNIICNMIDAGIKFVTSHEPMDAREEGMRKLYQTISSRIHVSLPRIYTDVPLTPDVPEDGSAIPERIKQMRNLMAEQKFTPSVQLLFYNQAHFMEDYEDDYEYKGKKGTLSNSYQVMSDRQLRGYFGWRTAYRAGKPHACGVEYPMVYASEIINGVGWKEPEVGFKMLSDLVEDMPKEVFPHRLFWLTDFCAVYNLQGVMPKLSDTDRASHTLECPFDATPEDALVAASYLADYPIATSKIMRENATDVAEVLLRLFRLLHERMENRPRTLLDMGFSPFNVTNYRMFATALFYDPGRGDYDYRIPGVVSYHCAGTNWTKTMYRRSMSASRWFGAIVRTVDSLLRPEVGVKGAIKPGLSPGTMEFTAVKIAVKQWMEEKNRVPERVIEVDLSKLSSIRQDADEVRDRILTEEERGGYQEPEPEPVSESESVPADGDGAEAKVRFVQSASGLGQIEEDFLRCLLEGKPYVDLLAGGRLTADIVADSINEALLDRIGDTVIDMSSGEPELIEDYREDLEEIING